MQQQDPPPSSGPDTWNVTSVPLSGIETELAKHWQAAAQAAHAHAGTGHNASQGVSRARVLNLVVYAGRHVVEPATGDDPVAIVDRVVATHPFRTILVVGDESDDAPSMSAAIKTRTHESGDGRKIMHDHVRIDARGPISDGLPSVILPLLLPDLPTYLWWPGDPPIDHAFWLQMVEACDRLILDSAAFSTPRLSLSQYAAFLKTSRRYHTFGDLTWTQLTEWRQLITQIFDNQACRPCLDTIERVTMEFSGRYWSRHRKAYRPNPAAALLLAGWLCSRLGWEPGTCVAEEDTLRYELRTQKGDTISLVIQPNAADFNAACMVAIAIEAGSEGGTAHFEVRRPDARAVADVETMVPGAVTAGRTVSLASDDRASLLAKDIDQGGADQPYEAAVAVTGVLAKQAYDSSR